MQSFLQLVAHDLYAKIGNNLSRTALIFPNKRANLFFNEYLAGESDQPIWSPAAMSISDLFQKLSVQKSGDPIRLVCELYKVFKEETQSQETLDDFYFWGELLISDFDDVDKKVYHLYLWDKNKVIAYARVIPNGVTYNEASIGRVLVLQEYRRKGIATELMKRAIEFLQKELKEDVIVLSAQSYAKGLYESVGFKEVSEVYNEVDIPHVKMKLYKN